MEHNISSLRSHDREDGIRDYIEKQNEHSFSDQAKLRYLANKFDEAVFTNGFWFDVSLNRPENMTGIVRIKVKGHHSGYKVEINRHQENWKRDQIVTTMKSEVKNTMVEALDFVEERTGLDVRDCPVVDISNAENYSQPDCDKESYKTPNRGIF